MSFKSSISRNLSNIPGWRSKRKIVVIESDDWGSIRMPSKKAFDILKNSGVDIITGDNLRFNSYDSLASSDDLSALFDVLSSVEDKNGVPAVISPISLMANPDFEKIRSSAFREYHYEVFTDTLKRIPGCENSFSLWKEGMNKRLFVPEFHGREHLNVRVWLKALREKDRETSIAYDQGFWGFNNDHPLGISYQAAFDPEEDSDIDYHKSVLSDGLSLFESLLGYKASHFVPPNGVFSNKLLPTLAENGIKYIFSPKIQVEARSNGRSKKVVHWLGQKNKFDQRYITRNCVFEPSDKSRDWVDSCMSDIAIAFKWHKPAIISSHRVNFIGSLDPANRSHGLRQLQSLLQNIVNRWSDVEFMSSSDLGKLICKS